jgi:hypothetical protein
MHTWVWIKFIIFALIGVGSAIGFIYFRVAKPKSKTKIRTWILFLSLLSICGFLAERYYKILFEL